jgi:hypothetical protein
MVRLYHGRTSVCSVKTRLALAEKGVDWESQLLTLRGDQFGPAYLKLPRDNQGETAASIRMRMRRGWTAVARA